MSQAAETQEKDLDRSLVQSIAWTGAARWIAQLLTWAITLGVARILTPEDYGLVGMAALYWGLVAMLNEFGLGASVVILRDLTKQQIAQVNGLAVAFGVLCFALSCASAYPLGMFFEAREVPTILIVLSSTFIITSFGAIPLGLLEKRLEYRRLAIITLVQHVTTAGSTLVLALFGFGYWALVASYIVTAIVRAALSCAWAPHAFAWPRLSDVRRATSVGMDIVGIRVAWYIYMTSDYMIAGKLLGKEMLGYYSFAFMLASIPVDRITAMVTKVTTGFFSKVQDDAPKLKRFLLGITEGLSFVTFPATFGLALVADDFVYIVLGDKWDGAIVPLRMLAAYSSFRSISPVLMPVLHVTKQTRYAMWVTVAFAVILPAGFVTGGWLWGLAGIAGAWIALHPFMEMLVFRRVSRTIDLRVGEYLSAVWPALSGALVMVGAVLAVRSGFHDGLRLWRFVACCATGAVVYGSMMFLFHRGRLRAARTILSQLRNRESSEAADEAPDVG